MRGKLVKGLRREFKRLPFHMRTASNWRRTKRDAKRWKRTRGRLKSVVAQFRKWVDAAQDAYHARKVAEAKGR